MGSRKRKAHRQQRPRKATRRHDSGVTLIEMMVVLVIIAIVAALIVPNVIGRPDEARVTVARTDVRTIAASLEMYRGTANRSDGNVTNPSLHPENETKINPRTSSAAC